MQARVVSRLQHPLVVALATTVLVLLGILALSLIPAWSIRPLGGSPTPDYFFPTAWSPDGSMFVTEGPGRFEVAAADGTILVRDQAGRSPVWIDSRMLLVVREVDRTTGWLVRVDSRDGGREMVGVPIERGRLVADGRGHVAHQSAFGVQATSILDPANGTVLARLEGYRAEMWTSDGSLIVARRDLNMGGSYYEAAELSIWRPGHAPRLLGAHLIHWEDELLLGPSGRAFACFCISTSPTAQSRDPGLYRVPLDGAPPTILTPWSPGDPRPFGNFAWINDETIAVFDEDGLFGVSSGGNRRPLLQSPLADLTLTGHRRRVYHFSGAVIVVTKDRRIANGEAQLSVIDDEGRLRLRHRFYGWSTPALQIDPVHHRAIVVNEPDDPEHPLRLFMLELS
jgi:ribosomal protein L34